MAREIKPGEIKKLLFVVTEDLRIAVARYCGKAIVELTEIDYVEFASAAINTRVQDIKHTPE